MATSNHLRRDINMEKILKIETETFDYTNGYTQSCDGYKITTDKQEILIGISNGQSCCENWGYLTSQDDFDDFIGATLVDVRTVDEALNVESIKDADSSYGSFMFVNLETNRGTLQFVLYNEHNGYYGHDAVVVSNQLKYETTL